MREKPFRVFCECKCHKMRGNFHCFTGPCCKPGGEDEWIEALKDWAGLPNKWNGAVY